MGAGQSSPQSSEPALLAAPSTSSQASLQAMVNIQVSVVLGCRQRVGEAGLGLQPPPVPRFARGTEHDRPQAALH